MARQIVRTDFVAGELAPSLWGRADQETLSHGVAECINFVPRKTGGVRKRAGTEFLWQVSTDAETADFRVLPYRYDKDAFGVFALYRKGGATVYWRFFAHYADGSNGETDEAIIDFLAVSQDISLESIKSEQIGDTLYMTLHGFRAFTAKVDDFENKSVIWKQLDTSKEVSGVPALTVSPHGFETTSQSAQDGTRKYQLWAVRDGIRSKIASSATAQIRLPWIAGAYIDISFTPNWTLHDYYILGKYSGGTYGEVCRFYMDAAPLSTTFYGGGQKNTGVYDGATWTSTLGASSGSAADARVHTAWANTDPNTTNADGRHACGAWVRSIGLRGTPNNAAVSQVRIWFGAAMSNSDGTVRNIALSQSVHVVLYRQSGDSEILAEWDLFPNYSDGAQTLNLETPTVASGYALHFYTDSTRKTEIDVPIRGARLAADTSTKTFRDDNISPGAIVGEQELLTVGNAGMDVDIISVWEQRLLAASSSQSPFTMWFSALGDLENFYVNRPQVSDDAFEATIATTRATKILHIIAQKWLLAFTESGEYVIDSPSGGMSYETITVKKNSGVGAHPDIVPETTETDVLFVAADARSLYQMRYSLEQDSVVPVCLSIRASHLTEVHRIRKIAYQRYPDSILWMLLDDGSLVSITYVPDENVCAWARHNLAGSSGLVAVDIFATDSIRADAETDTTSDICIVLRHPDSPKSVWLERLRPCVVADAPTVEAASCVDHAGYPDEAAPPTGNPAAPVAATLSTLQLTPQGALIVGAKANVYDAAVRIRRSGALAVHPHGLTGVSASGTLTQGPALPTVDSVSNTVALVSKDVKIAPKAFYGEDCRLDISSVDEWPCEILALSAAVSLGNMEKG